MIYELNLTSFVDDKNIGTFSSGELLTVYGRICDYGRPVRLQGIIAGPGKRQENKGKKQG